MSEKVLTVSVKESTFGDDSRRPNNFNPRSIPEKRDESLEMPYEKRIQIIDQYRIIYRHLS